MNQKIHEILEGIELYVDNIEEKDNKDKVGEDVLPKLTEIHKQLGELDISIKASGSNEIKAKIYEVTAESEGVTKTEKINTKTNILFKNCKNKQDVKNAYESFWNDIGNGPKVKVKNIVESNIKTNNNEIKADLAKWKQIWSEYGKSKDTCIKDVSLSYDVNNPETFCDWLEKLASDSNQTVASEDKKFVEFWEKHIISKSNNIKSDVLNLYKEHLSQYIDTLPEIKASEEIEKNFIYSIQFGKFNEIVLATLTKGLKLGTIKSAEYDDIIEKFGIKATEEDINKLVADETIPEKPSDVPPAGKKYTWDAKAKLWVLTDVV